MGIFLKKYTWLVYLLLIFIGTLFLAKIGSTVIASKIRVQKKMSPIKVASLGPIGGSGITFEEYRVIMERNIFDSRNLAPDVEATAAPTEENLDGPPVKTSLSIKLISTVSVGDGSDRRSSASVASNKGKAEIYSIEDEKQFSPGVKIIQILPDRIIFINNRRKEFAEIETFGGGVSMGRPISALDRPAGSKPKSSSGGKGIQEVGSGKYVVDRAELDSAMGSIDKLFTQIRAVPQFKNGKASGLKLLSVRRGSLFAKLGLRRNDVLKQINGKAVDMKQGMQLFNSLKDSDRISIDLVRNGQKTTLEYDIQ